MHNCDYCGKTVLFGGEKVDQFRFCSSDCSIMAASLKESYRLPDPIVNAELGKHHQADCAHCRGKGPVDIRYYHSIWSIIYFTRWSTKYKIACQRCGAKSQIFATLFSLLFGWWGFPHGLLLTPIQIWKNVSAIINPPSSVKPSKEFEKLIRLNLVESIRKDQGFHLGRG